MLHDWRTIIKHLILLTAAATFIGMLVGNVTLVLLLGFALYLIHTQYQLLRFMRWLSATNSDKNILPPEAFGFWGDIFDDIYRMQSREREAVEHLKNIIDKAQESTAALEIAVVMINSKSSLVWWNNAAEKLLGFRAIQDKGQVVTNLIREPRFIDYFQQNDYRTPLQLPSPVNARLILELQITKFGEGERLLLVRDITQLHKLEMIRKDFVANVSHELRTPITVITGYLESLLDHRDAVADKWIKPIEQMYQQSRRMENIIRDLLTLSSLETRSTSKKDEVVDVNLLLSEIKYDAAQVFLEKCHKYLIESTDQFFLEANMNELYSAVSNLVLNAAKYSPEKGVIKLKAYRDAEYFYIEVQDNGIGIAAQHIPRLTERFYRIDESRSTDTGGTGLGLAIVKHVLARHNATLNILSETGNGSRFICQFPVHHLTKPYQFEKSTSVEQ